MSLRSQSTAAFAKRFAAGLLGAGLFVALPMACETSPKEDAEAAGEAFKRGDMGQAVEESGEAVGGAVEKMTK